MKINQLETNSVEILNLNKFTVLVGPNNVGKSQSLKDIHSYFTVGTGSKRTLIKKIVIEQPDTFDELLANLDVTLDERSDRHIVRGIGSKLSGSEQVSVHKHHRRQFANSTDMDIICGNIGKFKIAYLDAESRLNVVKSTDSGDRDLGSPENLLQALYTTKSAEDKLKEAFFETFEMAIRLDYSALGKLAMRVGKEFNNIPDHPREALPVMKKYQRLDEEGDGYKSFVGVVLSLLLSQDRIVLLDEPEAFLHPAQARKLGYWIAEHAKNVNSQIIVATHNAHFLGGILASGQEVDIYRLNRKDDHTTFNHISKEVTSNLAKSPLLSSQRVLDSIFHKGVVVCEADADRAVYQTVASREHDNQEILFIHAHNKQTIPKVISLLRKATIPVRAIADIDMINSPASLLDSIQPINANVNTDEIETERSEIELAITNGKDQEAMDNLISEVTDFLQQLKGGEHDLPGSKGALNRLRKQATSKWDTAKKKGIEGTPKEIHEKLNDFIRRMNSHGLFIVPVGELEGWLDLDVKDKRKWNIKALEALHDDKCSSDLREFVGSVLDSFEIKAGEQKPNS